MDGVKTVSAQITIMTLNADLMYLLQLSPKCLGSLEPAVFTPSGTLVSITFDDRRTTLRKPRSEVLSSMRISGRRSVGPCPVFASVREFMNNS